MATARHTPPGDASFRTSLLRNGASALGLVVVVALVFWGIGSIGGEDQPDDAGVAAGDRADDTADHGEAEDPEADDPGTTPDPEAPDDADAAPDDDAGAEPDEQEPDGDETDPDAGDEADDGDAADGDEDAGDAEADEPAPGVDPGSVTIQVLDGFKEDGGTAADQVASLLGESGYQVVARNDALTYEVTTVLYNPGNEAAARQVAAELGGADVREQPGNLSGQVDLHVVVGQDRG
ncbi:MAG: LytR C-terminal domain-containing protein [Nitriliruptor sp.]